MRGLGMGALLPGICGPGRFRLRPVTTRRHPSERCPNKEADNYRRYDRRYHIQRRIPPPVLHRERWRPHRSDASIPTRNAATLIAARREDKQNETDEDEQRSYDRDTDAGSSAHRSGSYCCSARSADLLGLARGALSQENTVI
jgi:hypothetical protein